MTGIVNSTGARSGVIGTITGTASGVTAGAMIQSVGNKNNNPFYSNVVSATTWLIQTSSFITTKGANSGFTFTFSGDVAPGASGDADSNNLVFFANLSDGSTKYNFGWYQTTVWSSSSSGVGNTSSDHDWYFLVETDGTHPGYAWRSSNMTYHSLNGNVSSYAKGTALQLNIGLRATNAYIGRHHGSGSNGLMGFTYGVSEIKG